jgi:hypothetical protein
MKVFSELLNRMRVAPCGARRVVATLEFFEHPVSELSHNDLLVTLTLSPTSTHPLGRHNCSIRRASGLVQTRLSTNWVCRWAGAEQVTKTQTLQAL